MKKDNNITIKIVAIIAILGLLSTIFLPIFL
jgi:hypothetical protein